MKDLKHTGFWKFEGDDNSYSGTLEYVENSFELTLLGRPEMSSTFKEIYGFSSDGTKITLYNCYAHTRKMSLPGIPTTRIMAQLCFLGDHFKVEEAKFEKVRMVYSSLNEWFDSIGFHDFKRDKSSISLSYTLPTCIPFYKGKDLSMEASFQAIWPLSNPQFKLEVNQQTSIVVECPPGLNLNDFWWLDTVLEGFFTLAYFSEAHLKELYFTKGDQFITCYYSGQNPEFKEKSHRRHFLFNYENIRDEFEPIFQKWLEIMSTIEPVLFILIDSFDQKRTNDENQFLNIVQAIEAFHRRLRVNRKFADDVYNDMRKEMLDSCPEAYKEWLTEKLNFGNEPNLQDRLTALFGELSDEIFTHLFTDKEEIIKQTKKTRNYLTHYDKKLENKVLDGSKLYDLTDRLRVFLLVLILKELGMSHQKINQIVIEGSFWLFNHLLNEEQKKSYEQGKL